MLLLRTVRGGASGSRRCTRNIRSYGWNQSSGERAGMANFACEVKVLYGSQKEEGGHDDQLGDLRARAKHRDWTAATCDMVGEEVACLCAKKWHEGG